MTEIVSLWLCKDCGERWWTRPHEPFREHPCEKHSHPMLSRVDTILKC